MIQLSRDEAIATARLASFISGALNNIGDMTTGSSRNISDGKEIDVNNILSQFTIAAPPKPPGPVIEGLAVGSEDKEVVLHPVEQTANVDEPVTIANPFAKQAPIAQSNKQVTILNTEGKSPIASFLKKEANASLQAPPWEKPAPPVSLSTVPSTSPLETPTEEQDIISKNNVASLIYEKLVSIELKLKTIQSSIKKLNENKSSKG